VKKQAALRFSIHPAFVIPPALFTLSLEGKAKG